MGIDKDKNMTTVDELRLPAEEQLNMKGSEAGFFRTDDDTQRLLHELQVHQLELEMQNVELRQTRAEMEMALDRYTDLYDFAPVGYFTIQRDGAINTVNLSGAGFLDIERSRLIGRRFGQFVAKEYRPAFTAFLATVFTSQAREVSEMVLLNKRKLPLFVQIKAVALASGQECQIALIDITTLKQAEEKQKTTLELLSLCNKVESTRELMRSLMLFFQGITDCEAVGVRLRDGDDFPYYETQGFTDDFVVAENSLCAYDQAGKLVLDSSGHPALDCMCGTILGGRHDPTKPFFTSRGSFWSSCTTELLAGTAETDSQAAVTRNRCNREGYESVALIPIRCQGETIGLFQFNDKRKGCFNVEKIARMEDMIDYVAIALAKLRGDEALQRSQQSLLDAQEISNLGSYVYDIPGDQWTGTTQMDSILGIDTHVDRSVAAWLKLVHHLQRAEILAYFEKNVEQKRLFDKQYRIVRENDGAERWVHWLGGLEYDAAGSPIRMVGTLQDITERKQAEDDLRSYARRLIEMEESLRKKLAAELHDEIGRNLTAISMNLAIISNSMTDEALRNLSARVQDSRTLIKGITGTVRSLMSGLRPPVLDDFGLLATLRWHAGLFSKRTGITVSVQADEAFPRLTAEKETALFRISQEALMNAAKHANTQIVTIILRDIDGTIWFSVVDEGNGFMPASSSSIQDGSGWGLKIMRERAELIGGKFQVDSAHGKGTTVSVNLPLEDV